MKLALGSNRMVPCWTQWLSLLSTEFSVIQHTTAGWGAFISYLFMRVLRVVRHKILLSFETRKEVERWTYYYSAVSVLFALKRWSRTWASQLQSELLTIDTMIILLKCYVELYYIILSKYIFKGFNAPSCLCYCLGWSFVNTVYLRLSPNITTPY